MFIICAHNIHEITVQAVNNMLLIYQGKETFSTESYTTLKISSTGIRRVVGLASRPIVGSNESCDRAVGWLTVESFNMSCSISYMASLIDNLYLLGMMILVIN